MGGIADLYAVGVKAFGKLAVLPGGQKRQTLPRHAQGERVELRPLCQLQDQAFGQIPCADSGRVEHLHGKKRLLKLERRAAELIGQNVQRNREVAALIQTFDQIEGARQ